MDETFDLYPAVQYDTNTTVLLGFLYSGVLVYILCLYKFTRPSILPLFEN